MSRVLRRGDIFWMAQDPTRGTEIRKTRPAVVISNDSCNTYGSRVAVLPITSNVIRDVEDAVRITLGLWP